MDYENKKLIKDANKDILIRKSALTRVIVGTAICTGLCSLYAISHSKYRYKDKSFVYNWIKGSLIFSSSLYISNEILFATVKYYNLYTNFWINYTLISYGLSKIFYRYLIRNHIMPWYTAIRKSHKYFLYLCVFNLFIEFFIYLAREIKLYDEDDIFDIIRRKHLNENKIPLHNFTLNEFESLFMTSFHIFNNERKQYELKKYMEKNPNNSNFPTIDLYQFYKDKKF